MNSSRILVKRLRGKMLTDMSIRHSQVCRLLRGRYPRQNGRVSKTVCKWLLFVLSIPILSFLGFAHKEAERPEVIICTSLDKFLGEPLLEAFEQRTGINILAVYNSEAAKTTGLVNGPTAEKSKSKADVFFNSEPGALPVHGREAYSA